MPQSDYIATTMLFGMAKIIPVILFVAAGYFIFLKLPFLVFLKVLKSHKAQGFEPLPDIKFSSSPNEYKPGYSVDNYESFLRRSRRAKEMEQQSLKSPAPEQIQTEKPRKEETAEEKRQRMEVTERRRKYAEELKTRAEEQMKQRQEQAFRQKEADKANKERVAREQKEKVAREERERMAREEKQWQEYFKRSQSRNQQTDPKMSSNSPEGIFNIKNGESLTQEELKKRYRDLLKVHHPDKVAAEGTQVRKLADKKTHHSR